MSINDKIKLLLKDRNLTPSVFADEIGVNRASISHILSGRNRPSYDIIQKIMRRFPDLGYEWMLEDDEPITDVNPPARMLVASATRKASLQPEIAPAPTQAPMPSEPVTAPVPLLSTVIPPNLNGGKSIERILIFYTDGTFKEYSPS